MNSRIATYFGLEQAGTMVRRKVLAGVMTFVTMLYIIAINPAILIGGAGWWAHWLDRGRRRGVFPAGRWREIHAGLWMLCGLSILFYIFYPYQ